MKIIEALKDLKLIEKKIISNQQRINLLSSLLSNEKPLVWVSDKEQTAEVMSILQSIFDLEQDYLALKLQIENTNNATDVVINGQTKKITEWLTVLRKTQQFVLNTTHLVSTNRAQALLAKLPAGNKEWIDIIPCFDEKKVTALFDKYRTTVDSISAKLEVVNATTDII